MLAKSSITFTVAHTWGLWFSTTFTHNLLIIPAWFIVTHIISPSSLRILKCLNESGWGLLMQGYVTADVFCPRLLHIFTLLIWASCVFKGLTDTVSVILVCHRTSHDKYQIIFILQYWIRISFNFPFSV